MSLKHHLYFILHYHSNVKALWLDQRENCRLSQCVCDCISCSFHSFKQFSWELFNVLHDLLIFTAFLFSDNYALLITCLNVLCSIINDLTTFFIYCMLLMIFIHFFIHSALIILCDLTQKVKISMIFFNAFSSYLMYSSMHWCLVSWFNNDFDICSFKILINFSSFIVFQLQRDFHADFLQTLKSIIVCINKWFEKFFISLLISHHINQFIMSFVVKIKFIIVWDLW